MCRAIKYNYTTPKTRQIKTREVSYLMERARIPILMDGGVELVQWGRRKGQLERMGVPQTCWAQAETLHKWRFLKPKRTRIVCSQWMEKDQDRVSHWFGMPKESYLLGLLIERGPRRVVYVVVQRPYGDFAEMTLDRLPVFIDKEYQQMPVQLIEPQTLE